MMKRGVTWIKNNKATVITVAVIIFIAALFRMTDLGIFLTADEKNWIGRSYEFIKAFKDWNFNAMLQTTHPGVTTLWLGGIAVTAKMFISHVPFSFENIYHFIKPAQMAIALTNSVMVGAIYLLLRRLFSKRPKVALLAALLIAVDPILVGYARVVHVDALLGSLLFAAAISIILYGQRNWSQAWLVTSGVFSALALLTKAPAVFIIPFFLLTVLVSGNKQLFSKKMLLNRLRDFLLWILIIATLIVVIWPAILWVPNPQGNVLVLKRDLSIAAATPHHMSEGYTLNADFYIYTFLTRSHPVILFFFALSILYLIRAKVKDKCNPSVNTHFLLVAFVLFFIIMMILGAKKGDRYILPVFFASSTLAALGVSYLVSTILHFTRSHYSNRKHLTKYFFPVAGALVMLSVGLTTINYHPYAIAYSNPLLPDNLSQEIGWGEGLEQVAAYLNKNDADAVVASWYPEELGAFTTAHVAHINAHEQGQVGYIVLYHNMFGRAPDHYANNFIDEYYKKREPVFTATVAGKEFAWVYKKTVYNGIIGELTPGREVRQLLQIAPSNFTGLDIMVATYSGQANQGQLIVQLIESGTGSVVKKWSKKISGIEDKGWTRFELKEPLPLSGSYWLAITTTDTGDRAPTVRYNRADNVRESHMIIDQEQKTGDLAVRLLYTKEGEIITEEDTRLLAQ